MPSTKANNIAENLQQIHKNISDICERYQRNSNDVQLLAVSKTKPVEDIQTAFDAGQSCFGENYLQEAIKKIDELNNPNIEWHYIGAIQSNKTRELAQHFTWVHTVDRLKIAKRLSQQRPDNFPPLNICLQVNISHEDSKSGIDLQSLDPLVDDVITLPNIKLRGLMAIPAKADNFDAQRASFARMKQALEDLRKKYPQLDTLSMGMSNDMEAAIAEGSTIVRIGTAIFGARDY